jgi:hypothetical protein
MLKVLVDGTRSSAYKVGTEVFTKTNTGNARINAYTPKGVLGGSVAAYKGDFEVGAATGAEGEAIAGLFVNNAQPNVYDNNASLASGKIAVIRRGATVEVDVYADNVATADVGAKLYADANGFLTTTESASKEVVGILVKKPTTADPFAGVDLRV